MTEELLTHATWLRRLAGSLVGDAADDVVQDRWVAALRRPPDTEATRITTRRARPRRGEWAT